MQQVNELLDRVHAGAVNVKKSDILKLKDITSAIFIDKYAHSCYQCEINDTICICYEFKVEEPCGSNTFLIKYLSDIIEMDGNLKKILQDHYYGIQYMAVNQGAETGLEISMLYDGTDIDVPYSLVLFQNQA